MWEQKRPTTMFLFSFEILHQMTATLHNRPRVPESIWHISHGWIYWGGTYNALDFYFGSRAPQDDAALSCIRGSQFSIVGSALAVSVAGGRCWASNRMYPSPATPGRGFGFAFLFFRVWIYIYFELWYKINEHSSNLFTLWCQLYLIEVIKLLTLLNLHSQMMFVYLLGCEKKISV